MSEPRPFTLAESRTLFVQHCKGVAEYWAEQPEKTELDRCMGVVHSIFTTIAGCSGNQPGYMLIPCPNSEDEDYHRERGENWHAGSTTFEEACNNDIGNALNHYLYQDLPEVDRGPGYKTYQQQLAGHIGQTEMTATINASVKAKCSLYILLLKGRVETVE